MTTEETFKKIYAQGIWGDPWSSGQGSFAHTSQPYLTLLATFLSTHSIKSVVEIGCGDWELSRHIDWADIDYLGLDIVSDIIERNQQYATSQITFKCSDLLIDPLPRADLILCKDVLQHLSNRDVSTLLGKISSPALITNDIDPLSKTSYNLDIPTGEYRPIDITMPPFLIDGQVFLTYQSDKVLKQVIYYNPK